MSLPTHFSDAGVQPSVGIAGHGGMPGLPTIQPAVEEATTVEREPSPPPRIGVLADEVYHKVGAANDITFVQALDGKLYVTHFDVMFSNTVRAKGGRPLSTANKAVHIYINGTLQPQLYMRVKADGSGFCTFPDGSLQPHPDALAGGAGLIPGVNNVRFEIRYLRDPRVLVAECFAFLWGVHTPVIVMDIDGTITRSDVPGLLMTLRPGIFDHTHSGICGLLTKVATEGAQVVYLTSRPLSLAPKTRAFLASTKQDESTLPLGPLRCCRDKATSIIWRELVKKNMNEYKMRALLDLVKVFREAGKAFGDPVFAAGIGNKITDAVAYRAAGIPTDFIFIINTDSSLQVWDGDSSKLGGSASGRPIEPMHLELSSSSTAALSPSMSSRKSIGDIGTRWLFSGSEGAAGSTHGSSSSSDASSVNKRNDSDNGNGTTGGGGAGGADLGFGSTMSSSDSSVKPSAVSASEGGSEGDDHPPPGSLIFPSFSAATAADPHTGAGLAADGASRTAGTVSPGPERLDLVDDATTGAVLSTAKVRIDENGVNSSPPTSDEDMIMLPLVDSPERKEMPAQPAAAGGTAGTGPWQGIASGLSARLVMKDDGSGEVVHPAKEPSAPLPAVGAGAAAAAADQVSPKKPSYVTYADERFFNRLRDSVKAVQVAVEAGKQAAENVFTAPHMVAGENRESMSLKHTARKESVEHAESRLAERVHIIAAAIPTGAGDGGGNRHIARQREAMALKQTAKNESVEHAELRLAERVHDIAAAIPTRADGGEGVRDSARHREQARAGPKVGGPTRAATAKIEIAERKSPNL